MSPGTDTPTVVSHPQKPVDVPAIERELARMWNLPGQEGRPRQDVIRACMSNLIIFCSSPEHTCALPDELDTIVRLHPARVLLLVGQADAPTTAIEATVTARCHLGGERHHVCSEQVTISASGDAVPRLPSTARSLLIGDLPTSLWWAAPTPPSLGGPVFDDLQRMADQVVYSSLFWPDPVRGTLATAAWVTGLDGGPAAADLAWRRLAPWRSLIGQSLDPAVLSGALDAIDRVEVEHGPHGLPQAWLLVGWLATRLGWQAAGGTVRPGSELAWVFHHAHGPIEVHIRRLPEGEPGVCKVTIGWKIGDQRATMSFTATAPGKLTATGQGASTEPRVLVTPAQARADLVAAQLHDLERDPLFRDALQAARGMAEALAS